MTKFFSILVNSSSSLRGRLQLQLVVVNYACGLNNQKRGSLQCRRILARSRASAFDQASAILDSNSE